MSIEHGNSHRCVCGRIWYDSDGEPCHTACIDCGVPIGDDDDAYRCKACLEKKEQEAEDEKA